MTRDQPGGGVALSLDTLLTELNDPDSHVHATDLTGLSRLHGEERERFLGAWRAMSVQRRRDVIDRIADLAEDNVELDFDGIFLAGLVDGDVQVRAESVKGLWEYEGDDLIAVLLRLLADEEALVRAEAALGLGRFLLRSELEDRDDDLARDVEDALRALAEDGRDIAEVRGRAVEALGVRNKEWVRDLIDDAYASGERRLQISAVHAMGRSADPSWLPTIMEEMHSDDNEMRFEAATSAGGIADEEAVPELAALTVDDDPEVQEAAIGALGQIGGPAARSVLHSVASDNRDPRVLEAVSDALAEADFTEDPLGVHVSRDADLDDFGEDDEDGA